MTERPWNESEAPLVMAYLDGELSEGDPEFAALIARRPELLVALHEMQELEKRLGHAAEFHDPPDIEDPTPEEVAAARQLMQQSLETQRAAPRNRWLLPLAALALVGAAIGYFAWPTDDPVTPVPPDGRSLDNGTDWAYANEALDWSDEAIKYAPNAMGFTLYLDGEAWRAFTATETSFAPDTQDTQRMTERETYSLRASTMRSGAEGLEIKKGMLRR